MFFFVLFRYLQIPVTSMIFYVLSLSIYLSLSLCEFDISYNYRKPPVASNFKDIHFNATLRQTNTATEHGNVKLISLF